MVKLNTKRKNLFFIRMYPDLMSVFEELKRHNDIKLIFVLTYCLVLIGI